MGGGSWTVDSILVFRILGMKDMKMNTINKKREMLLKHNIV